MLASVRRHGSLLVAALVGGLIASVTPAVAQATYDAINAKQVDGKMAVGYGASIASRKGKLVATNGTSGRLPNNIIATAPDAARLDGYSHAAFRTMSIDPHGAYLFGATTADTDGVVLDGAADGIFAVGFVIPPDHKPGTPLYLDMLVWSGSGIACAVDLSADWASYGPVSDGSHSFGAWNLPGLADSSGTLAVPAGNKVTRYRFTWAFDDTPGHFVDFRPTRHGGDASDTCGGVVVVGLQLRY